MNYYIKGDAANADKIKAAFKAKGIDTASNSLDHDEFLYYSSNGLLYFEDFSNTLLNVFKTNPGYTELELSVEHKFKVGDWVVSNKDSRNRGRITSVVHGKKYPSFCGYHHTGGYFTSDYEDNYHLWTIADAEDGDVLVDEDTNTIGIFEKTYGICWHSKIYCGKSTYNTMVYYHGGSHDIKFTKPATKEQRDLLFARIREAGYEWDAGKKELRKTLKVGDWVVRKDGETFYGGNYAEQITLIEVDEKGKCIWLSSTSWVNDDVIRPWTIADAKDGDVLVSGIDNPFIYDGNIEFSSAGAYVGVSRDGRIRLDLFPSKAWTSIKDVKPSTKEQRDLLFAKIREAGYEWDADKKELRRRTIEPTFKVGDEIFRHARNEYFKIKGIEKDSDTVWYVTTRTRIADNDKHIGEVVRINAFYQDGYSIAPKTHYDISNFKPFDKVLVRQNDSCTWGVSFFGRCSGGMFMCCTNVGFEQCIPYNDDTKHLLGTTDPCDEQYINW